MKMHPRLDLWTVTEVRKFLDYFVSEGGRSLNLVNKNFLLTFAHWDPCLLHIQIFLIFTLSVRAQVDDFNLFHTWIALLAPDPGVSELSPQLFALAAWRGTSAWHI